MPRIGLIAGNRRFPLLFASAAKKKSYSIVAVAFKGETHPAIGRLVEKTYWLRLDEFSRIFEVFKSEGITEVAMAGQISPRHLFRPQIRKNLQSKLLLDSLGDKRADTIFGAIAKKLQEQQITLVSSTLFLEDFLPQKGVLTKKQPEFCHWEDIYLGMGIAKEIAFLDIGQTVSIKDKAIVAIEALEGTDNLIRRAGAITRSGAIIVKVSKPAQDLRFDVPVVGLNTVKNLVRARAAGLAIEAKKTLFLDCQEALNLANRKNIFIVAV